ncbi:unnamed protein product [Aspergillus oryzae]|uniref:Unnamed protein product n=2 Tax=Aspergillus oryzae TaxID=5062 RepID=A0AAN5BW72_ASPOZ|nr:unnamed protein product [Aspergillus oryzae]GMF90138.1 unnamed protein product [Aspergillus oryzae]GMG27787.1 unnamed protein product [Aspergillus oryzae]GMG49751.1 unnamed protein product [Aspergillus oryzae var. brunneus]
MIHGYRAMLQSSVDLRSLISLGHQERSETFIMLDLETLRGSCGGSFLFLLISSFNALRMHLTANPVSVCLSRRSGGKVELLLFRDFPCNNILLPGVGRSPLMPQWAQISPLQLRRNADDGCLEPIWFNATTFALILTGQFDPVSSWGRLSNVELREPRNFTTLAQVLSVLASQDDEGNSLARRLAYTDAGLTLDIDPLPSAQRKGLIAVTVMAFLSFIATLVLLLFITYRLVFWRSNYARYIGYNQYIVLIYNLVLADLQQSLAFLICLKWITENKIEASSAACFLQGFWLQIGDPGSGLFVLAIAVHTFILVALGHKLSHRVFVCGVVGVWLFVAILVIIPLAAHGRFVFIPSGAWVRVLRFPDMKSIAERNTSAGSAKKSLKRLRRVIGYMIIYPVAYIVLSLPLAAGRMATAQGQTPSIAFFCVAGAVITSSGLVDVLLYTLTRRNLILESEPSRDRSYNRFASSVNRKTDHLTTITAAEGKHTRTDISVLRTHRHREDDDEFGHTVREGSTDNIVQPSGMELAPLGKVYQHTTIEITHEPAYPEAESSDRSSKGSIGDGKGPAQSARMWGR